METRRITYTPQGGVCSKLMVIDAIGRLSGIDCHGRGTSCPDQMAQALKQFNQ